MAPTPRAGSSGPKGKLKSDVPVSLFNRILTMLGMEPDPDRERKHQLKELKKSLQKSKGRFFANGDMVDIGLPKAMHELYSVVGPARVILANAAASNALKMIFIEQVLTNDQKNRSDGLTEDAIRALAKTVPADVLVTQVRETLSEHWNVFDMDTQARIDARYNLFLVFMDLVNFNYYFMLKKFDSMLPEADFNYLPRWEAINGEYVVDDLKDFLAASSALVLESDWDALFDVLKIYKGIDVLARPNWKRVINILSNVRRTGVLLQLVQYLSKDPGYQSKVYVANERVVDPYLTELKNTVESTLAKIALERKTDRVNSLATQVFGTTAISRTKNYTEKMNVAFQKKRIAGFSLVDPMNYLKAFLLDYYKRDVREIVNLLLVKGQWVTNTLAAPLSDSFHQLMEVSDKLTVFDDLLAEDAEKGAKLKALLMRSDKDVNAQSSLKMQLKTINGEARTLIIEAATHLIVIGKHIKMAIDDYAKPKHELILNWKQLETATDKVLKEWLASTYKQLYAFVQLMQFFVKEQPPAS